MWGYDREDLWWTASDVQVSPFYAFLLQSLVAETHQDVCKPAISHDKLCGGDFYGDARAGKLVQTRPWQWW